MVAVGPVLFIIGLLMSLLAVAMSVPALVDLATGHADWQVFAGSAGVSLFVGTGLMLVTRTGAHTRLGLREAFLLTTMSWLAVAIVGAMPFAFSDLGMGVADAFFESMSGITTTGSTVIADLDAVSPGILLWRALLQWLGGVGIIVMALAILPILSVGGMQLFVTEAFDTPDKVLPRAASLAGAIFAIYLLLTSICALALWLVGFSGFDAITHAMTTIATGGYSTRDGSIGFFENPRAEWIIVAGMIIGSLPFVYYLSAVRGEVMPIFRDSQVQWFLGVVVISVGAVVLWLWLGLGMGPLEALRYGTFNVISVLTGTGYSTAEFDSWGGFPFILLLCLMFVGGCAGSTTCGIKIFRFQVLYATARVQVRQLMLPHGVFIAYYNRKPISESVSHAVMGFFYLYICSFVILAAALGAIGLDFVTAMSGAATALSNVGPGLGETIGPSGNFSTLPEAAKWLLSIGMLLGRLELFTVLVLFSAAFWTR
ncbi:MAG: TrkH family potassium uptake protein [Alphaproteobacteria bacterium]|nr:TrkH family potassium uptake protein [Alphaproteobacteria bacterium]